MAQREVAGRPIELVELGDGRPVVFLHGNGPDHRDLLVSLDGVFAARPGYRRFHLDLPGYGRSPGDRSIHGSDGMADVVVELIDALSPDEPVILVGASWGAYLARGVLARRPDRVAGIAMLCPVAIADRSRRDLDPPSHLVTPDRPLTGGEPGLADEFLEGSPVAGWPQWVHFRDQIAPALALVDEAAIERIEAAYSFIDDVDVGGPPTDIPALIVTGRQDPVVGYRDALRLVDRFARSTFVILDVAGHGLPADRPAVTAALVDDWLERIELGHPAS
jgi:pimeloyl-ACP methyl ester carboxylesterase